MNATVTPASTSDAVTRDLANKINPLISDTRTEETLHAVATLIEDIGYVLSQFEFHGKEFGQGTRVSRLYLIAEALAAALRYEIQSPLFCTDKGD